MIIWINGAFGSGKTQTAHELFRRLDHAIIYDPENAGYWLRQNEPKCLWKDNFQDEPLWRTINRDMLIHLSKSYSGTIIVPMTLIDKAYYLEIIGQVRESGAELVHFVLLAENRTIKKRLKKRFEFKNSWAFKQLPRCNRAFADDLFENKLFTDQLSIPEVAETIAKRLGLSLLPRSGRVSQAYNRIKTQLGAVRLF